MDLKDVLSSVTDKVTEANNAYHAGHPEKSHEMFSEIMTELGTYFTQLSPDEVAALAETTSGETAQEKDEQPAQASDSPASQALPASQFLGENAAQVIEGEKPNQ